MRAAIQKFLYHLSISGKFNLGFGLLASLTIKHKLHLTIFSGYIPVEEC